MNKEIKLVTTKQQELKGQVKTIISREKSVAYEELDRDQRAVRLEIGLRHEPLQLFAQIPGVINIFW